MLRGEPAPWHTGSLFSGQDFYFGRQYFMASNDALRCKEEMALLPIEKQRLQIWVASMHARILEAKANFEMSCEVGATIYELSERDGALFWLDWHLRGLDDMSKEIQEKLAQM